MNFPSLTFYTQRLPAGVGGLAVGPVVLIQPQYCNDVGIHCHEQEHVRQWWVVGLVAGVLVGALVDLTLALAFVIGVHPMLYQFVRRYRQWAEVRAYVVQMRFPNASGVPLTLAGAAMRLMFSRYRLRLTLSEAKFLLLKGL